MIQRLLQPLAEQRAVGEAGQGIEVRLVTQLLALREVGEHDGEPIGEVRGADGRRRHTRRGLGVADAQEAQQPAFVLERLELERAGPGAQQRLHQLLGGDADGTRDRAGVAPAGRAHRFGIDRDTAHGPGVRVAGHMIVDARVVG